MTCFEYSADKINQMIDDNKLNKVCMRGVYDDLQKLKPLIEKVYDDYVFYLSYWKSDAPYHGWLWREDDGRMKNQATITSSSGLESIIINIFLFIFSFTVKRFNITHFSTSCQANAKIFDNW